MYNDRLRNVSRSSRKESKQTSSKSRDLSMKSSSNNTSDMSVEDYNPSYDSLMHKANIKELEEIKAEDSYEYSEINDLKEHIIYNDSEENENDLFLFFKNQKYRKKIFKKCDKQTIIQM